MVFHELLFEPSVRNVRTIVLFVDKHVSAVEAEETLCAESGVELEVTAMDLAFQVDVREPFPPGSTDDNRVGVPSRFWPNVILPDWYTRCFVLPKGLLSQESRR